MAHGIAVHGGIVEGRQVNGRHHLARNHAPARGMKRHRLDLGDRYHTLADDALDLVHREQRTREGEAVIGELRHHPCPACAHTAWIGAACRIKMSAIRSTSSRSTTGTRAAGSGSSDATATIAGSSG